MKKRKPPLPSLCCPPEPSDSFVPLPAEDGVADEQLAWLAKALAHPIRVRILRMLAQRNARMCADLVDELPLAQSTVSEHLRVLRAAGLVSAREDGLRTGYCINPAALRRLKALVEQALPTATDTIQHQP